MSDDDGGIVPYVAFLIMVAAGILLSIFPMPLEYAALRPQWLCLIIIYWAINSPFKFGVVGAWFVGMFADIVFGSVWGGHAAALSLVAYLCLITYQRVRRHPMWQQTLWVFMLVAIHQTVVNWFEGLNGYSQQAHHYLISIIISALFWPVMTLLCSVLRRRYRFH